MSPFQSAQFAAQAALTDLGFKNTILPTTKINLISVNNWDERFLGYANRSLIDSGGYSADSLLVLLANILFLDYEVLSRRGVTVAETLEESGILVVANIRSSGQTEDLMAVIKALKSTNSRVFITLLDTQVVTSLYFHAARYGGLVGPGYVWISLSPFENSVGDLAKFANYTYDERNKLSKGLIYVFSESTFPSLANQRFRSLFWGYVLQQYSTTIETPTNMTLYDGEQLYDCIKIMMVGMDQYLSEHPNLTPNDLSKPEHRKGFSAKFFSNRGYSGVTSEWIEFNDEGEMKSPCAFYIADETTFEIGNEIYAASKLLGRTDIDGDHYYELKAPIFQGNSSGWPSEDQNEQRFDKSTHYALLALIIVSFGVISASAVNAFNIFIRRKALDIHLRIVYLMSCGLLSISLLYSLEERNCKLVDYSQQIALGFIFRYMVTSIF
ncbi:hypothetical protein HDU97_002438 [Phlyctochytrium planicorne]|nr:hypothetical protein HDU97_002438 [Phlyctochytrium planicorne]